MKYLTRADIGALRRESQARSIPAYRTADFTTEGLRRRQSPLISRKRTPAAAPNAGDECWKYQLATHRSHARSTPRRRRDVWYVKKTGDRMVEGSCTSGAVDDAREILVPAGMQCDRLPVPMYWEHNELKQAGEIVFLERLPEIVFARGIVDKRETNLWSAIEAGEIFGWSVHADPLEPPVVRADGVRIFTRWKLREVSIVRRGANEECLFWPWTPPGRRPVQLLSA